MIVQSGYGVLANTMAGKIARQQQGIHAAKSEFTDPVKTAGRITLSSAGKALAASEGKAEKTGSAAEIAAKGKSPEQLTSSELDYMQKAGGLVNTMANLSPAEKELYDKAVASGNTQAVAGLAQIALIRTGGHMARGANGTTYDPINTAITAVNVEKYFRHSIFDPSGDADAKFQALIQFLQNNSTTS